MDDLRFSGNESINLLLRVLDDALSAGVVKVATVAEVIFILTLTLSLVFMLGHYVAGGVNLPRSVVTKMTLVWFLGLITSNWLALLNLVGDTFTNWGLALGGDVLALGSFRQPAYLLQTGFAVVKSIWTYGSSSCQGLVSCCWSTAEKMTSNVSPNQRSNSSCHWIVSGAGQRMSTRSIASRSFISLMSRPAMIVLPAPGSSASRKRSRGWGSIRR